MLLVITIDHVQRQEYVRKGSRVIPMDHVDFQDGTDNPAEVGIIVITFL